MSQLDQNIRDFIIFNDLSNHLLPTFEGELQVDAIPIQLRHIQELSDDVIWELLPSLSMYSFVYTIKLLGDADFVKRTVAKVLRSLDAYYLDHRQGSLVEQRICTRTYLRCFSLFYAIVFPPEDDCKDKVIFVLDEVRRYIREKGNCYVEYYACPEVNSQKSLIYNLLHEIDRQIRIICKRMNSLSASYMPDPELEVITNSIAQESQTTAAVKRKEATEREAQ